MRRALTAVVTALASVTAAAPAQANPTYDYHGGCSFFAIENAPAQWVGEVDLHAAARDWWTWAPALVPTAVECVLHVNDARLGTVVLSASGNGVVAKAEQFSYTADPNDVVWLCTVVTVGGDQHEDCGDGPAYLIPGPPIVRHLVLDAIDYAVDSLDEACPALVAADGGPADHPPAVDIRDDGDLYVAGEWIWDCPPTGSSGS